MNTGMHIADVYEGKGHSTIALVLLAFVALGAGVGLSLAG